MKQVILAVVVVLSAVWPIVAFAPPSKAAFGVTSLGGRRVTVIRTMSDAKETEPTAKVDQAAPKVASPTGTFYDDEVEPPKDPLSNAMRERLIREATTGLDPEKKQTNVLLYIIAAVAVLVVLGGKDVLY